MASHIDITYRYKCNKLFLQFHDGNNKVIQNESILEADDVWILKLTKQRNLMKAFHAVFILRMAWSLPGTPFGSVVWLRFLGASLPKASTTSHLGIKPTVFYASKKTNKRKKTELWHDRIVQSIFSWLSIRFRSFFQTFQIFCFMVYLTHYNINKLLNC